MAEHTKIQWTDCTFNPWIGCSRVSEGCQNCYAEYMMDTRYGRVIWGPEGTRDRTKTWKDPLRWNREAASLGERRKVFCASLADVFEDYKGPDPIEGLDPWRRDLFQVIDQCPSLDFLLLTKRPENVRRMWIGPNRQNCWIGTSISNQRNADECIPRLLSCTGLGPILFLSVEPQIGPIDLSRFLFPYPVIQWVIVGGESQQGHQARPFNVEWARILVQQCREARIPCFVKQMGTLAADGRIPLELADKHGGNINEWPEDVRVRECPEAFYPELVA